MEMKNMTNGIKQTIKQITLAGLVGLSTIFGNATAGPISGNVGYIQREKDASSYEEVNAFYGLPMGVKGYTFLDRYNDHGNVFGKTTLTKQIADYPVSAKVQGVHCNEKLIDAGVGLEVKLPTPKGITAKVNATPLWMNGDGKEKDVAKVGYFVAFELPAKMSLSSFGELNVANAKGVTFGYGEVALAKQIGNLSVEYNASLNGKGDGIAKPEVRSGIAVRYKF
jgi:hypothetical protein